MTKYANFARVEGGGLQGNYLEIWTPECEMKVQSISAVASISIVCRTPGLEERRDNKYPALLTTANTLPPSLPPALQWHFERNNLDISRRLWWTSVSSDWPESLSFNFDCLCLGRPCLYQDLLWPDHRTINFSHYTATLCCQDSSNRNSSLAAPPGVQTVQLASWCEKWTTFSEMTSTPRCPPPPPPPTLWS